MCAPGYGASNARGAPLSCTQCPLGSFSPQQGTVPCQYCPAGTLAIDLVDSGRFGPGGTQCLACPSGLVVDDNKSDCRCPGSQHACLCPGGWASAGDSGTPPCVKCGAFNSYAEERDQPGSKTCVECPSNSVATDGTSCACLPGHYSKDGSAFVEGGCQPCPSDTVAVVSGSTKCRKCAPNMAPNANKTECVLSLEYIQQ